jgi:hypothetical protein
MQVLLVNLSQVGKIDFHRPYSIKGTPLGSYQGRTAPRADPWQTNLISALLSFLL